MDPVRETWTALQRREGPDFLRWLDETQALRAGFRALANGLLAVLKDQVQTKEQVRELWAAVPAVLSRCNDLNTYSLPGASLAYAWLHLPERYVRTWQALELLVEHCLLPMGKQGVRALDVGTGPGPSAFATHDFYAAMTNYAELSGNGHWNQPPNLTCVESSVPMNSFRHQLAEVLAMYGAPQSVLAMCGNDGEFEPILPNSKPEPLYSGVRKVEDYYYNQQFGYWEYEVRYTLARANAIIRKHRRYRLFTFSNFLTAPSVVDNFRSTLTDILASCQPGSVFFVVGGTGGEYPAVNSTIALLASQAGFSRSVQGMPVSVSDAAMDELVYSEGVHFYHYIKSIAGRLSTDDPNTKKVILHFEGQSARTCSTSSVSAYRKMKRTQVQPTH